MREEKLYGNDDPVFPRTRVKTGGGRLVRGRAASSRYSGRTPQPIRRIFREAFAAAGLPYFRPHSFRDTLVQYGERHAPTIEHFKAWSQNLGHEHVGTTLTSYGNMGSHRQGELVRSVVGADRAGGDDRKNRELFDRFMRLIRDGSG